MQRTRSLVMWHDSAGFGSHHLRPSCFLYPSWHNWHTTHHWVSSHTHDCSLFIIYWRSGSTTPRPTWLYLWTIHWQRQTLLLCWRPPSQAVCPRRWNIQVWRLWSSRYHDGRFTPHTTITMEEPSWPTTTSNIWQVWEIPGKISLN